MCSEGPLETPTAKLLNGFREVGMARNVQREAKAHPDRPLLVYCGSAHAGPLAELLRKASLNVAVFTGPKDEAVRRLVKELSERS